MALETRNNKTAHRREIFVTFMRTLWHSIPERRGHASPRSNVNKRAYKPAQMIGPRRYRSPPDALRISPVNHPEAGDARNTAIGACLPAVQIVQAGSVPPV